MGYTREKNEKYRIMARKRDRWAYRNRLHVVFKGMTYLSKSIVGTLLGHVSPTSLAWFHARGLHTRTRCLNLNCCGRMLSVRELDGAVWGHQPFALDLSYIHAQHIRAGLGRQRDSNAEKINQL